MKYNIKDVRTGMVLRKSIMSIAGNVIVQKDTVLTYELIQKLRGMGITALDIVNVLRPEQDDSVTLTEEIAAENAMSVPGSDEDVAKVQAMRNSESYKKFRGHYEDSLKSFERDMSDFLNRQNEVDPHTLIGKTTNILDSNKSSTMDLLRMMYCMENMDKSTYAHSLNVSMIARILGEWMGMKDEELDILTLGGLLHDIGKLDIDPEVLFKPTKLTKEEFELVKAHPMKGYTAVQNNPNLHENVKMCILQHHERFDGSGYPLGYRGDQINRYARIITIADVYDALTSRRCYKAGMSPFRAAAIIQEDAFAKYSVSVTLTFLTKIVNSYLGENVFITGDREVKIIQINDHDLIHPLVVDLQSGEAIDLHRTGDEIIRIL